MADRVIPLVFEPDQSSDPTQIAVETQGSTRDSGSNGPEEPQHVVRAAASQQYEAQYGVPPAVSQPTEGTPLAHAEAVTQQAEAPTAVDEDPTAVSQPTEASQRAEGYMLQGQRNLLQPPARIGHPHLNRAGQYPDPHVVHNLAIAIVRPAQIGPPGIAPTCNCSSCDPSWEPDAEQDPSSDSWCEDDWMLPPDPWWAGYYDNTENSENNPYDFQIDEQSDDSH